MNRNTAERTWAELVSSSQVLTGKSDSISEDNIPLLEPRQNVQVITPRRDLNLTGRRLTHAMIHGAMDRKGFSPGHLLELILFADKNYAQKWDEYTTVWATGQTGIHTMYGKESAFFPKIWGKGNFHDLGISGVDRIWTDSDHLIAVRI